MEFFTDESMRSLLSKSLETAALGEQGFYDVGNGPGSEEGAFIDWLTIADRNKAVVEDVQRIRRHALVPKNIPIHGYVYEVETGRLLEVPGARDAGASK
jgi:carbonic anhydrase